MRKDVAVELPAHADVEIGVAEHYRPETIHQRAHLIIQHHFGVVNGLRGGLGKAQNYTDLRQAKGDAGGGAGYRQAPGRKAPVMTRDAFAIVRDGDTGGGKTLRRPRL